MGPDITTCDPFLLDAGEGYDSYQWFIDGVPVGAPVGNTQTFNGFTSGTYKVVVEHPICGFFEDEVVVTAGGGSPSVSLPAGPIELCDPPADTLTVTENPFYDYAWEFDDGGGYVSVGANENTLIVSGEGTYRITVTDNGLCPGSSSATVAVTTDGVEVADATYCPVARGGTGTAAFTISNPDSGKDYLWTDDQNQTTTIFSAAGTGDHSYTLSGLTGTFNSLGTTDTTIWVGEDLSAGGGASGTGVAGPTVKGAVQEATYTNNFEIPQQFDALTPFTLNLSLIHI